MQTTTTAGTVARAPYALYTPHTERRDATPSTAAARLGGLDGLRGIAVLLVIAVHAQFVSWGWIGVDLFFALSGFLITGILLDAKSVAQRGAVLRAFYARRALRILPLSLAFLALVFVVAPRLGIAPTTPWREQRWYWTYLSNWQTGPRSPVGWQISHFWSLAVEEQFYCVWPWIVLGLSRRRVGWIAGALLVVAPLVRWWLALSPAPQIGHPHDEFTVARLDCLAAGALVAVVAHAGPLARFRRWWITATVAGLTIVVLTLTLMPQVPSTVFRFTGLALATAGVVALIAGASASMARWLDWPPMAWIGTVSYGIYIVHRVPLELLRQRGVAPGAPLFLATTALALVIAGASWYLFERPILSLKRHWPMPAARVIPSARAR
jgi:peptidoglycan/LPS O-acetylase OafA/YrhL